MKSYVFRRRFNAAAVGNENVKDTIQKYLNQGDIQNFIFYGPAGTGKTTLCRLLGEYTSELRHYDVGSLINTHKLYTQWNEKYNLPEFDDDMVVDFLEPEI